jgi:hypothetical protein
MHVLISHPDTIVLFAIPTRAGRLPTSGSNTKRIKLQILSFPRSSLLVAYGKVYVLAAGSAEQKCSTDNNDVYDPERCAQT